MEKCKRKIVSIDMIQAGMTTSQDIFTNAGQMLIASNTLLDERHIDKLKLYMIHDIPIKESVEDLEALELEYDPTKELIKHSKKFKSFKASYNEHTEALKNQLLDISEGKYINISELFSLNLDLISSVQCKSDLFNFLTALQHFDNYTYSHSLNVALICYTLGQWLGFKDKELMYISVSGLLHDIGKTKIDKKILNKPGKLTNEEYEEIKKHTIYGFQIVENQDIPHDIKMAVLMHHERYDGKGYPLNMKNEQISDFTKIVAISDVYDALTSDRPYRNKYSPFHVIREFEQNYLGHLDTKFLMTFLRKIAYCYLGSTCTLSSGEKGKIIFINKHMPSQPIVQIDNVHVDLSCEKGTYIESII